MRRILALLLFMGGTVAIAEADTNARLWVRDLQGSEELVAAAIATTDAGELRRQSVILTKLIGRIDTDLSTFSPADRMDCVMAVQSLNNVLLDLSLPPARATVAAKRDAADYRASMARCEKTVGVKGKRTLLL